MKKFNKHIVTLAIALALVGSFVLGASASSTLTEIKAYLNYGITIEYKGEAKQLFDANGVRLYPITYNGSTYVPIRAISQILGENVDWNGATQTVILGTPADGVDLINKIDTYTTNVSGGYTAYQTTKSSDEKSISIAGITLNHWIHMCTRNASSNFKVAGYYNIGNKYGTLTFQAYSNSDITLEVRGNNDAVLASIPLKANQLPETYTVPLAGSTQLSFSATLPRSAEIYIFDATLN